MGSLQMLIGTLPAASVLNASDVDQQVCCQDEAIDQGEHQKSLLVLGASNSGYRLATVVETLITNTLFHNYPR